MYTKFIQFHYKAPLNMSATLVEYLYLGVAFEAS